MSRPKRPKRARLSAAGIAVGPSVASPLRIARHVPASATAAQGTKKRSPCSAPSTASRNGPKLFSDVHKRGGGNTQERVSQRLKPMTAAPQSAKTAAKETA